MLLGSKSQEVLKKATEWANNFLIEYSVRLPGRQVLAAEAIEAAFKKIK